MLSELQPICLIFALMFSAVFAVAGISKYRETRRARNWVVATGRVTESKVRSRRDRSDETQVYESMPLVVYEYAVEGKNYRGTKINFAEKISGTEIAPTLKKYPEGKIVKVYYNPANPSEAVLEKDFPQWLFIGVGAIIAVILLFGLGMPFVFDLITRGAAAIAPQGENAAPATMACGMGLFALLMVYAMQKQVWGARDWQTTTGKILDTSIQARDDWDSDGRYTPLYNSEVVYSFFVGGEQYISDRVALGGTMRASVNRGVPGSVSSNLKKYPKGASVTVYYDPHNPSECALERRANGMWLVLLVAVGLIAFGFKLLGGL